MTDFFNRQPCNHRTGFATFPVSAAHADSGVNPVCTVITSITGSVCVSQSHSVRSQGDSQKLGIPNALYLPEVSESSRKIFADLSRIWQVCLDKDGKPSSGAFVDEEMLISFNFRKKTWDLSLARNGDLIVFQKDLESDAPYHLMIFVQDRPVPQMFKLYR